MRPHIWRKRSNLTIVGYMWIVLNQADILKRHPGQKFGTYGPIRQFYDFAPHMVAVLLAVSGLFAPFPPYVGVLQLPRE